jgi:hypothetical protein
MRDLSRTGVLVCALALLLLALPAQAAPRERAHTTSPAASVAAWLDSVWNELTGLFRPAPGRQAGQDSRGDRTTVPTLNTMASPIGSCIDPDGSLCI